MHGFSWLWYILAELMALIRLGRVKGPRIIIIVSAGPSWPGCLVLQLPVFLAVGIEAVVVGHNLVRLVPAVVVIAQPTDDEGVGDRIRVRSHGDCAPRQVR